MNEVRVRVNPSFQEGNLHVGVHPFKMPHLVMMMGRQSIGQGCHWADDCMPEGKRELARLLFDEIPGLTTLFFDNGGMTLQHTEVFTDSEVFDRLVELLIPRLQEEIRLRGLLGGAP